MIAGVTKVKQPAEHWTLVLDCSDNLFGGSIQSVVVTAKKYSDGSDATATIITGSATINSPLIQQDVHQGTSGEVYVVEFKTTMSGGQVIEDEIILPVQSI